MTEQDTHVDYNGLSHYDMIQKQRFSECGTVSNQEKILSIVSIIKEKIELNEDADSRYEEIAKKLEELV